MKFLGEKIVEAGRYSIENQPAAYSSKSTYRKNNKHVDITSYLGDMVKFKLQKGSFIKVSQCNPASIYSLDHDLVLIRC